VKIASIDIGSNSILLLIAEVEGSSLKIIHRDQNVTALGRDLDKSKVFHPQSMQDSFEALSNYSRTIKDHGLKVEDTIVTATEASRVAVNSKDFFSKIKDEIGFDITTISGAGEAHYSAKGACLDVKDQDEVIIMDIGGASTELVKVKTNPFNVESFVSLPIGSVRVTNWIEEGILNESLDSIKSNFIDKITEFRTSSLLCVAGTMTSIANMHQELKVFEEEKVHNYKFSKKQLDTIAHDLIEYKEDDFLERYPFLGKRAKAIGGGLRVAKFLTTLLGVDEIVVSTYGLMFGTALDKGIDDGFIFR
jgi:exopolyphosphatase/guanosine-5'-triphosphate,3'-diphosphate pyrophosphatase